jgi:hypothetical protein
MTYDEICNEITRIAEAWFYGEIPKEEARQKIAELQKLKRELFESIA